MTLASILFNSNFIVYWIIVNLFIFLSNVVTILKFQSINYLFENHAKVDVS